MNTTIVCKQHFLLKEVNYAINCIFIMICIEKTKKGSSKSPRLGDKVPWTAMPVARVRVF